MTLKSNIWGRYNNQGEQSLANQIQRANFWQTMLIVLCLGGSMLALSLSEVLKIQGKENQITINLIGQILTTEIKNNIDDIANLALDPIIWASLTNPTRKDVYLRMV